MATKIDYSNLPCPVAYEEISREALITLRPEVFDGFRVDYVKQITPKFALTHSISMDYTEIPSQSDTIIKIPTSQYGFGATFFDPNFLLLVGRVTSDGTLNAKITSYISSKLSLTAISHITNQPNLSNCLASVDYKGGDFRAQAQLGSDGLYAANYMQSVTQNLSLGGEAFYHTEHGKSGVGFAARYEDKEKKNVAVGQVSSTGMVFLSYFRKAGETFAIASDFMFSYLTRDVVASVGYSFTGRQCAMRGKIDSNGKVSGFLEEKLNEAGLKFVLSAEFDHPRKDHRFGFGVSS